MDPILGEIKLWAISFTPKGWLPCDGRLLPISNYSALFSLFGTAYGGNGTTNFALPDLRGRVPVGQGTAMPGIGASGGVENVSLITQELPPHNHPVNSSTTDANQLGGLNHHIAAPVDRASPPAAVNLYAATTPDTGLDTRTVTLSGEALPHNNMQPYLALNFFICTSGVYPARS